mmetsp:Transcript_34977/g.138523  ORF Transcript_34977/g.138523 Transcript_34977/m.138523 type:complete len:126 (-) Transcript_34977:307-684(-)
MPGDKYFRFNPPTNCTDIDQTDPSRLAFWVAEAKSYIETETARFERLAQMLRPRKPVGPLAEVREALTEEVWLARDTLELEPGLQSFAAVFSEPFILNLGLHRTDGVHQALCRHGCFGCYRLLLT